MIKELNFRSQPVWNKARHLALTLSLVTDSFPQVTSARTLARKIQRFYVDLLLRIGGSWKSPAEFERAQNCIDHLAKALNRAQKKGLLKASEASQLARQLKAIAEALSDVRASKVRRGSGGTIDKENHPHILTPYSTGALYD